MLGGGIKASNLSSESRMQIINSTFKNNTAEQGGSIHACLPYFEVDLTNFTDNNAADGGAIYLCKVDSSIIDNI